MCHGRGHFEVVRVVQDECKDTVARIEELAEVVTAKLGARQLRPVIECIDIRIAADGVGDELLAPI